MARQRTPRPPEAPPTRRRWVVLMLVAMIVAAAAASAQTWTNLRAIDYGYKISKATRQRARLQQTNRRLRVELALLKRPERIARLATRAGLRPPEPAQVRRLILPPLPTDKPARQRPLDQRPVVSSIHPPSAPTE